MENGDKPQMKYTEFTEDYYLNQLSSNIWIQNMTIEKDIIQQISVFSAGIIQDCNNSNCNYEVSISTHHINLFTKIKSEVADCFRPQRRIMKVVNGYKEEDGIYYYDDQRDESYCKDCIQSMKPCNENGFHKTCRNVIVNDASNTYLSCSCTQYTKKLCLRHGKCDSCNLAFCGEACNNIVNKEDRCTSRECNICGIKGCPQCVPMISFDASHQTDPPSYYGKTCKCYDESRCMDMTLLTPYFKQEYYDRVISINPWIKTLSLGTDIIQCIVEFAEGDIRTCQADDCNNEVLVHDPEMNIFENITSSM